MTQAPPAYPHRRRTFHLLIPPDISCANASHLQSLLTLETSRHNMPDVGAKRAAAVRAKQKPGEEIVIPDKLFFRIGEVSKLCALPAYVLRFWETEFPQLKPNKSSTGQRVYRRKDVENIVRVKKLLYEEGYTISGARQFIKSESKRDRSQAALPFARTSSDPSELHEIKQGLREVLGILSAKR